MGFPSSFRDWKSRYFFISRTGWETSSDDFWGEVPRLLRKWEVLALGAYFHYLLLFFFHILITGVMKFFLWFFTTLDRLDLEDQYRHRVRATLAYAREIEDFDDLVDPHHLYDCCLGPEPSKYILEKIHQEEKSKIIYSCFVFLNPVCCLIRNYFSSLLLLLFIFFIFLYFYFLRNGH